MNETLKDHIYREMVRRLEERTESHMTQAHYTQIAVVVMFEVAAEVLAEPKEKPPAP